MEQTSKLLGITQWELSDYIGQSPISEAKESQTVDIKKRAKLALEFFEK
jgi:CRISPR/Cas system-associated protein Cas7 (RAMP superfamily)